MILGHTSAEYERTMNVLNQGDVSDLIFQQLFPVVVDVPIDFPPEILGVLLS